MRVSTSSGLRVAALPFTSIMSATSHMTSVGGLLTLPPVPSQSTGASLLGNVSQDSTPAALPRSQTATTAESPSQAPSVMVSAPPLQTTHPYPVVNQLPPLSKFMGEDLDQEGENFEEWIEHFEMVAEAYGWDAKARLVNLTTRLQGQAYSFYRSCSPEQRADYGCLKTELLTHFTPVRLQAVHSNLFHQRKQEESETVDHYAQELKRLFYRAYPELFKLLNRQKVLGGRYWPISLWLD